MACYEYICKECGWTGVRFTPISDRDNQYCENQVSICQKHYLTAPVDGCEPCRNTMECGSHLVREEISETQPPKFDKRYRTKAVLRDGSKIEGQFGRSARTNKGSM